MAQARRKKFNGKRKQLAFSSQGIGMLLAGVVIGSLGTILWQGMQSNDGDVGSGIRQMMEISRQQTANSEVKTTVPTTIPDQQSTNYDFFTVLPEIEVVVTNEDEPAKSPPKAATEPTNDSSTSGSEADAVRQSISSYMLQAGSYNREVDAERQKANLGLLGLTSAIQKVTIQGRGDFFRVRLGPFPDHSTMVEADQRLQQEGIKALRLKISKAG